MLQGAGLAALTRYIAFARGGALMHNTLILPSLSAVY